MRKKSKNNDKAVIVEDRAAALQPSPNPCAQFQDAEEGLSDAVLIKAHLKKQPWAFEVLFKRHRERVGRIVFSIVKEASQTEDTVQEVFLQVHRHLKKFKGKAAFTTWLHRIAMNEAFKTVKRQRKWQITTNHKFMQDSTSLVVMDRGKNPERFLLAGQEKNMLHQAMQTLSPMHRFTLTQHYIEEMPIQDIAHMMETPLGSVKSRLYYARAALRDVLAPIMRKSMQQNTVHRASGSHPGKKPREKNKNVKRATR